MNKCSKTNKLIYAGMVVMAAVLGVSCYSEAEPEDVYRMESNQDTLSDSGAESDQNAVAGSVVVSPNASQAVSGTEGVETKRKFSYFINWEGYWNYPASVYHIGEVEIQPYYVPILLVEIPDDRQKEERINRMLLEHYVEVLPDAEEDWWQLQEIRITYRSERYFCFRYVANTTLPEGCSYDDLYVTLDLEQEKILPYSVMEREGKKYSPQDWGKLYKEMELYQEKTVAEQSALRGEQSYEIQMVTAECDGTVFSCVGIDGLADQEKQKRINGILQEPIKTCIMNEGWKSDIEKQQLFDNVKIYIAY